MQTAYIDVDVWSVRSACHLGRVRYPSLSEGLKRLRKLVASKGLAMVVDNVQSEIAPHSASVMLY